MKSTFSRNFVTYTLILLAALLLVGTSFQLLVRSYLTDKTVDSLKNNCATVAQLAAAYGQDPGITSRDFLVNLSVATKTAQTDAVICDSSGMLLLCSDAPLGCEHQGLSISSAQYLERIRNQEYVVSTGVVEGLYTENRHVVSTAIRDLQTGQVTGIVMVSAPIQTTLSIINKLTDTYIFISVLVVLVALTVMIVYSRKTTTPLRTMAKTANAFGHGDLKARVAVAEESPQEIRELALAFNNMARSLEKSEYRRQEFVANVSHELKTPMTTISGYIDGILDGTIPPEQQKKYLQIASQETKRLSRLVRSMLEISRLQEETGIPNEHKRRFDIGECAGQVLISFERKINEKNLEVLAQLPEHPAFTFASHDAITQVIYNLTDNAVKFCPAGGKLGLKIRSAGNKLYVSVSNTGPTIPAEELPLLFDRFHKLDKSQTENRDGWGLGLSIVKMIICGHGEDISVTSENGLTEFTFTLPLVN